MIVKCSILSILFLLIGCSDNFHENVKLGQIAKVKAGLETGDVDRLDDKRRTALWWAVHHKHLPIVELLLSHGASTEALDTNGVAPIHVAAESTNSEILRLIVESGADVNALTSTREPPIVKAVARGRLENVKYLITKGATLDFNQGGNLLSMAVARDRVEMARLLIDAGVDIDARNTMGNTPLHIAAQRDSDGNCVALLLESGSDASLKNDQKETPLDVAKRFQAIGAYELLLNHSNRKQKK